MERLLLSGGSGLVGSALRKSLENTPYSVMRLVRRAPQNNSEIYWDPEADKINAKALEGIDAVIHLSGENIASGRWTEAKKEKIFESRVKSTSLLSHALASLETPPKVLVAASAIGFYGSRRDEELSENSAPGEGFLADVCKEWEIASGSADAAGIRVVRTRMGVVLSKDGGALKAMLTPFSLGLGGPVGNGRQYISWISMEDLVRALMHCVENDVIEGPVNLTAPEPVTNKEFSKALGKEMGRPALIPTPAAAIKLLLGELGEETVLASTRAIPKVLLNSGFAFKHTRVADAIKAALNK